MENLESLGDIVEEFKIKSSSLSLFDIDYKEEYKVVDRLHIHRGMSMPILVTTDNVDLYYKEISTTQDSVIERFFSPQNSQPQEFSPPCTSPIILCSSISNDDILVFESLDSDDEIPIILTSDLQCRFDEL